MDLNKQKNVAFRNIKQILTPILEEHFPECQTDQMEIKSLVSTTNQVFKVTFKNRKPLVFRYLSPIVDREKEGAIVQVLSNAGVGPKCYFNSLEYRLDSYIENARHASPSEIISNPYILKAIIEKINEFHQVKVPESIPKTIVSEQIFSQESRNKYVEAQPFPSYNVIQFQELKNNLLKELVPMKHWVEANFGHSQEKIKLCHNDLNNLNIFVRDLSETQKEAVLIDFDYVGYNYVAYDLANFLNETCFEYGGDLPGFKLQRKLTREQIYKAASYYESRYKGLEEDIIKMLVFVNFYWALWSIYIKPSSAFDPLKHGVVRWELVNYYRAQCEN